MIIPRINPKINKLNNLKTYIFIFIFLVLTFLAEINIVFEATFTISRFLLSIILIVQLVAAIVDLKHKIIPISLIIAALLIGTAFLYVSYVCKMDLSAKNHLSGGLGSFIIIMVLLFLSKGQIGTGDLMLFTVTGFYTGMSIALLIICLSILISGVYSTFLLISKRGSKNTEIPFAPFILLATIILSYSI